jgi:solute carrier family 25 protein 33/36
MTAATLTSPLDVLKTRLQSDFYQSQLRSLRASHPLPPSSSITSATRTALMHFGETLQILRSIHVHEGWRALFKGLGPNLVGVVPARAINFSVYGNGKRIIGEYAGYRGADETTAGVHLTAAAIAGMATGTATNPIWLVKTRLQLDKSNAENGQWRQYKNSWDCIKQTVRHEGVRGLYKGLSASYLGVTESSLQWVMYEQMKRVLARRQVAKLADSSYSYTFWDDAELWGGRVVSAGMAKLFAAAVTYPHEVVRTRLRQAPTVSVGDGKMEMKYTGLVQCFKTVWKEEGMVGLYGGLTPHLLRVVPSAAIMFGM